MGRVATVALVTWFCVGLGVPETHAFGDGEAYLLLAAKNTGTMQAEVDAAAAKGYQVRLVSPTSGQEVVVLMERTSDTPRLYKLLATTRTGTMQGELNASAAAGYRLVRGSGVAKALAVSSFLPTGREEEIVVLMERDPTRTERFEYRLLATALTGTLTREIGESRTEGFELSELLSRNEHIVLMQRALTVPAGP